MKKKALSRYRVPLLAMVLTGLGVYFWYTGLYGSLRAESIRLQHDLVQMQDSLSIIQALKPQVRSLEKELDEAQGKLDSLKSIFPDQKEVPRLLREITSVANASGITATTFTPLTDVEREYYVENRYSMSVEGDYHAIADFYAFLANFALIINLSNMQILANPAYEPADGAENYRRQATTVAQFEMTTFSSKR